MEDDVFLLFGVPKLILCDNGTQYRGSVFKNLTEKYAVKIRFNAHYHPQANPTECVNQTLKTMISMYVSENHRVWDKNLSQVACALRTARNETTKRTPYFINFGQNMIVNTAEIRSSYRSSCEYQGR